MTKDEALRMALEALESGKPMFDAYWGGSKFDQAITAIKEALAQPEQEPSYWLGYGLQAHTEKPFEGATPVYTTPPQRTWVGLTDDEIAQAMFRADVIVTGPTQFAFARDLEAKLKEKNT